jgi:hypothetical protein
MGRCFCPKILGATGASVWSFSLTLRLETDSLSARRSAWRSGQISRNVARCDDGRRRPDWPPIGRRTFKGHRDSWPRSDRRRLHHWARCHHRQPVHRQAPGCPSDCPPCEHLWRRKNIRGYADRRLCRDRCQRRGLVQRTGKRTGRGRAGAGDSQTKIARVSLKTSAERKQRFYLITTPQGNLPTLISCNLTLRVVSITETELERPLAT